MRSLQTTFEEFAVQRMDSLLRLARLLTGNQADAEDLVQSSLLRAQVKWSRIASADRPDAYVRRLLVNVHHSAMRQRRLATVELEETHALCAGSGSDFTEIDALRSSISRLPLRQRTALVLRYYEDLDIGEIAEAMGLNASSVRSALTRALATLRSGSSQIEKAGDNSG